MINPPLWKASVSLTKAEAHDVAAWLDIVGNKIVGKERAIDQLVQRGDR